jgi:hypothetical protein
MTAGGMAQVVEHLARRQEALNSNLSNGKNKKERKEKKRKKNLLQTLKENSLEISILLPKWLTPQPGGLV